MGVITERALIKGVADRWDAQYEKHRGDPDWADKFVIGEQLRALNLSRVSAATVEKIIGNSSWTDITCDACRAKVVRAVQFETREDSTFTLCPACLEKANREVAP